MSTCGTTRCLRRSANNPMRWACADVGNAIWGSRSPGSPRCTAWKALPRAEADAKTGAVVEVREAVRAVVIFLVGFIDEVRTQDPGRRHELSVIAIHESCGTFTLRVAGSGVRGLTGFSHLPSRYVDSRSFRYWHTSCVLAMEVTNKTKTDNRVDRISSALVIV